MKFKNSDQISFELCKISIFNCLFLSSVILHKLTTIAFANMHIALDWCGLET